MTLTPELYEKLKTIAYGKDAVCASTLRNFLDSVEIEKETEEGNRTGQQNRGLHKFCSLLAEALNDAGKDMRVVLKPEYSIPWDTMSVKKHIWKPIMHAMFDKESTTELNKTGEIDKVHKVIMREMGEKHGIEYIPFPVDEKRQLEEMSGVKISAYNKRNDKDYPEYMGAPLL